MLSNRFYRMISCLLRISRYCGASALKFDAQQRTVSVDSKAIPRIRQNFVLNLFWTVSSLFVTIQFHRNKDVDRFNLTLSYWIAGVLVSMIFWVHRFFSYELCGCFNQVVSFLNHFRRKFQPNYEPNRSHFNVLFDVTLLLVGITLVISTVLMISLLLYDQTVVIFLGGFVPKQYYTWPIRLIIIVYHSHIIIVLHLGYAVCASIVLIFCCYLVPIFIFEMAIGRKRYKTHCSLRSATNIRLTFRSIEILAGSLLQIFGPLLLAGHGGVMLQCLFGNFVLIRYWKGLEMTSKCQLIVWMCIEVGFWGFLLQVGGIMASKGTKTINSWLVGAWCSNEENIEMKKFNRSCRPILMCYGKRFVVKRVTIFLFMRGVVRGTMRALLASK